MPPPPQFRDSDACLTHLLAAINWKHFNRICANHVTTKYECNNYVTLLHAITWTGGRMTRAKRAQISPFYCNKFNECVSFLLHTFDKDFMWVYKFKCNAIAGMSDSKRKRVETEIEIEVERKTKWGGGK